MKKKKYLPLYYEWMEKEEFPFLCHYFGRPWSISVSDPFFNLLMPSDEEIQAGEIEGYGAIALGIRNTDQSYAPSPLRQNIVLFLAAMNNEL